MELCLRDAFGGKQIQSWITTQCLQESVHTEIKSRFSSMTTIQSTAQNHVKVTWRENKTVGKPSQWIAPQSPDLSPIERKPSSVAELVQVIQECWAGICVKFAIGSLIFKIPLLWKAVLDAKGGCFDEKLAPQQKTSRAPLILGLS